MSRMRTDYQYFGGDTEFILAKISEIFRNVAENFPLDQCRKQILVLIRQVLSDYQQAGINRISLGVQSMQNSKLKLLGSIYSSQQVI